MIILLGMKSVDDDILIDDGVCIFHPRNPSKGSKHHLHGNGMGHGKIYNRYME